MAHQPASNHRARLHADIYRMLGILMQRDINDPRLQGVSITRMEVISGGHTLLLWVHRMNETDTDGMTARLRRLLPHFTHELCRAIPRRRLPSLEVRWDTAFDQGDHVLHLLNDLRESS